MNLTLAELSELPCPAALLDDDGVVVVHTREWRGAGPGAVSYPLRRGQLAVGVADGDAGCVPVLDRLLAELDRAAATVPHRQALRVAMLAASLRVVAGRQVSGMGTSADTLEHACAGIAARTALSVSIEQDDGFPLAAPAVAALVLVQLAANAERHDRAASVALRAERRCFTAEWAGEPGAPAARTARRHAERDRWGLGFARIAADSIGGAVYPPARGAHGRRSAVLEVGLTRLNLPLALIRDGAVVKATRAWDEETGVLPGGPVAVTEHATRCVDAAAADPGALVTVDGWCARVGRRGTWVAIPPDGVVDRARDVLDGVLHERALWDGVAEPGRSRIAALGAILQHQLGGELPRIPGETWNQRAPAVARAYGLEWPLPRVTAAGALDPRVALYLATELGDGFDSDGDELRLRFRSDRRDDALVGAVAEPGAGSLRLS